MSTGKCSGGSNEADKDIEEKLAKLELGIDSKKSSDLPAFVASRNLLKMAEPTSAKDDLYYFAGIALMLFSVFVFFQHVHVGTGILQAFGFGAGGFGLLMLPLLVGIGLIIYNKKNKIGYAIISITCALVFYAVLSSLIMTFSPVSLLGLIIMLLPLAAGGAFFVKGLGGPKGIEDKLRQRGLIKSEVSSDYKSNQ